MKTRSQGDLNTSFSDIDTRCVNTIRTMAIDAIQAANSGHPGAPLGLAPAAYVLWTRIMNHNPKNPNWVDRDRFVLSGGHASMLLYSMLYFSGYGLTLDDIKNFRQWDSKTPGHPEYGLTTGVETTTGPLGQGFSTAVGMAMAERHLASRFNQVDQEIIDHYTYVMCGDGDLMEGITSEAASLAGHLGLGKLICIYDSNRISIEGSTDISFTEDVAMRFNAYHWQTIAVEDGNDLNAIYNALLEAQKETEKPTLIVLSTQIAYGSPNKQGSADAHGAPLGVDECRLTKLNLGCPEDETFCVPDDTLAHFAKLMENGQSLESDWNQKSQAYKQAFPELYDELQKGLNHELVPGWDQGLSDLFADGKGVATRAASGKTLNALAEKVSALIGGSADLAPSNNTLLKTSFDFQKGKYGGRNIRFGVREHAMGAIANGMALHKGVRPFIGTFLVFADYMRPAIRLACLMEQPVIYVFTHDSIAVGEDGPTHQPVEHVASLRAIPGLTVLRPADALETVEAWKTALTNTTGPTALILSRQGLPIFDRSKADGEFKNGAYIVCDAPSEAKVVLIASGSEVKLAVEAQKTLEQDNIPTRVVSMPSWELFEAMPDDYRQKVLPENALKVSIEAGLTMGWERYVGSKGITIGINHFGASAPGGVVMEKFGFTSDNIVHKVKESL